jgi:hypothetical protein
MGLAFAMLLLPLAMGSSAIVVLMSGALWAPQLARVLEATLRYTVDKTTREVLFLPVPLELKHRAKPFIDVTADRFAKALAAVLLLALIKPWGLGLDWRSLELRQPGDDRHLGGHRVRGWREYRRAFRDSIGSRAIAPGAIRTDLADTATIETLVEELVASRRTRVLYAIEMLDALDKRHLVTPLLLQHQSPRSRAREPCAHWRSPDSRSASRWLPTVSRMVQDEDVDVRAAALRALAELEHEDAAVLMRRHLADAEPRVVVTSAITLANSGVPTMCWRPNRPCGKSSPILVTVPAAGRAEAATALAHIDDPRFRALLVPLLYDRDPASCRRRLAVRARWARLMVCSSRFVVAARSPRTESAGARGTRWLTAKRSSTRWPTRFAINASMSGSVVIFRRRWPSSDTQRSMDALVAALDDPDGFLRYKAITAIEKIPPRSSGYLVSARRTRGAGGARELALLQRADAAAQPAASSRRRPSTRCSPARCRTNCTAPSIASIVCSACSITCGDVAAARYTIEQGEARRRAAAVEYLDNLLGWRRAQARDADPGRLATDREGPLRERRAEKPTA